MDKRITAYEDDGTTKKFQTLVTTSPGAVSTAITANKILITSGLQANFIEFGSAPTATTSSFVLPANTSMQFNFVSGQKVSALSHTGIAYVTIVDMD
jgi:hypothetical protein